MPDSTFDPNYGPIPPTHPAIKALTVVVGLGFLLVLATPYLGTILLAERSPATGLEGRFARKPSFPQRGMGHREISEPFKGITTDGSVIPGLFPIRSTGVTTEPVRLAAEAFLESLSSEQRTVTTFPVDDNEWRDWMEGPIYHCKGVSLQVMSDSQRDRAMDLARASLSDRGFKTVTDIMRLNHHPGVVLESQVEANQGLYFFTVMGTPSTTEPWGWQLEGSHLVIDYFVMGDQVVMTPTCLDSEPAVATTGKNQGIEVLQDEQNKGLEFVNSLTPDQRKVAVLASHKGRQDNVAEAFQDNAVLASTGIKASEFTDAQRTQFLGLIEQYVGIMDDGHARIKLDEVRDHLDKTYFAWIGGHDAESVFHYRIQSPVILIEFDHQNPGSHSRMGRHGSHEHQLAHPDATRQHIHTVVRTPNGNDYGKELLRQHQEQHPLTD